MAPQAAGRRIAAEIVVACLGGALLVCAMAADRPWLERHVLPEFFSPRLEQVAALAILRLLAAAAGLFLLLWARPRAGRLIARVPARRLAADVAPTLAAVLLALGVSEVVLRRTAWLGAQEVPTWREPIRRRDPELGWINVPGRTGRGEIGGRIVEYAFDPAGYRVRRADRPVDPARPTILFTGESIMAGHGLAWDETIPGQVEALTGVQSANLAVEGYATDQAYLRLRKEWPRFQRPVAVVALFMPSLAHRNLDLDRPHLEPGLVWRPAVRQWRLTAVVRRLVPYRSEAEIARGVAATRDVLRATVRMAEQRGATAIILVPQLAPETPEERALRRRILDEAGLPYVRVEVDPSWRIADNRHPDARAARAIAEAVAGALRGVSATRPGRPRPAGLRSAG